MDGTASTFRPAQPHRPDVLIVEDEAVSRRAMASLLASSGYHPAAYESAEEALEFVAGGEPPRVALVDVDLPGMSGLELVERLKEMQPEVTAVLITAAEGDRIDRFRSRYRVMYFRKPVDFGRLLQVVNRSQPVQ